MFRVLLAAQLGLVASFRGDPSRTLVEVPMPLGQLAQSDAEFAREDFESVFDDRVIVWASQQHLDAFDKGGIPHHPAADAGAINFKAEQAANYTHTKGADPEWDQYCDYTCMSLRLEELVADGGCKFPVELVSTGQSVNGRDIWAFRVGSSGPEVLMAGNIHGDETTGGQLVQRWLWETCREPSQEQERIAITARVWYMPMFNPDGYEANRRGNGNNADLNRSFPQVTGGNGSPQVETTAYMNFASAHEFVASIMYHGGAVVANYAYDNCYTSAVVPRPCPPASTSMHANHAGVLPSATAYAEKLAARASCNIGSACLVNGAAWYQITGSLQDWAFHFRGQLDLTLEVSSVKRPSAGQLPGFYTQNFDAMVSFIQWAVDNPRKTSA